MGIPFVWCSESKLHAQLIPIPKPKPSKIGWLINVAEGFKLLARVVVLFLFIYIFIFHAQIDGRHFPSHYF